MGSKDLSKNIHELVLEGNQVEAMTIIKENPSIVTKQDDSGRIPLHWAASGGHLELSSRLLDITKNPDPRDDSGWTPLIISVSAGHAEIVEMLLNAKADVNAVTDQGRSSLLYASSRGREDSVAKLISVGADVHIQDKLGATPLHRAAGPGHIKVVNTLLSANNVKINSVDNYGNTALHAACEEERLDVAKVLIKAGADVTLQNKEEKTPLEMCTPGFARSLQLQ